MDRISLISKRLHLSSRDWLGVGIAALFALSQIAFFEQPVLGVWVNAGILIVLFVFGLWKRESQELMLSIVLLPMSLLMSLNFSYMNTAAQSAVFYGSLIGLSALYRFLFAHRRTVNEGAVWRRINAEAPYVIIIGVSLGLVACLLHIKNSLAHTPFLIVVPIIVVTAVAEELLFRGLIQERANQYMRPIVAAMLSAVLYALFHSGTGLTSDLLFGLVSGGVLSALYYAKPYVALTMTANILMKFAYIGFLILY